MIYNPRFCELPANVATPNNNLSGQKLIDMSKKLCHILRHDTSKVQPINMGGWFMVDDLYEINPDMTIDALLKVVMEDDKQRFQLAVHT
eukprot:8975018-Heterocapsa_arctica.AAC.1